MRTLTPRVKITLLFGLCLVCAAVLFSLRAPATEQGAPSEARAAEADKDLPPDKVAEQLNRRIKFPGIDDPKVTLAEVLDLWSKQSGLQWTVNGRAFRDAGVMDVVKTEVANPNALPPLANARAGHVLRLILDRVPSASLPTYLIRTDGIEITTLAAVYFELGRMEGTSLLPLVTLKLDRRPLAESLQLLSRQAGVSVVLDGSAGEKAKADVTATFVNVPLDAAVAMAADMGDLQPVLLDNALYVTTREKAKRIEAEQLQRKEEQANRPRMGNPGAAGGM
jgi:hypothetical protein